MINWQLFPRSARPVSAVAQLVAVFERHEQVISSRNHHLNSDGVLTELAEDLNAIGFTVEKGKADADKIKVPVLFGLNGNVEKSFNADAFHQGDGVVLEVEAGRAVANNVWLKDLIQACMMQDAKHLVIAVRNDYREADDFAKVRVSLETLFTSNRLHLPLQSVTVIGY